MPLIQTHVEGFQEYHKIDTLFERDERFVVNPDIVKQPVLATISQWNVTEKIDGTNIRVMLSEDGEVSLGGRSNAAQIPADLMKTLAQMFPSDKMRAALWPSEPTQVILFGERYGAGIQKGGCYRPDKSFILFDVLVGGKWWLERDQVAGVASQLGCDIVPDLGLVKDLPRLSAPVRLRVSSLALSRPCLTDAESVSLSN